MLVWDIERREQLASWKVGRGCHVVAHLHYLHNDASPSWKLDKGCHVVAHLHYTHSKALPSCKVGKACHIVAHLQYTHSNASPSWKVGKGCHVVAHLHYTHSNAPVLPQNPAQCKASGCWRLSKALHCEGRLERATLGFAGARVQR